MIELLPELCNPSFKCAQLALYGVSPLLLLAVQCKQLLQVYLQLSSCRLRSECCSACHTHDATDPLRYGRLLYSNTHTTKHVVINTTQHAYICTYSIYYLGERKPLPRGCFVCVCPRRTPLNTSSHPPAAPHLPAVHPNIIIDVLSLELK